MSGGIAVIMPAFNAAKTIKESIQSVLLQSLVTELIIVDDNSSDNTANIALTEHDERIKVVTGPGQGISAALNCGFQAATSEFVARCDADDLYVKGRLNWQLSWLLEHGNYVAISAGFQTITQAGQRVANLACEGIGRDVTGELLNGTATTSLCTWLIRAKAMAESGGARDWFVSAEDLDLQFRLAQIGNIWHEPKLAYRYRLHDASITHKQYTELRQFYESSSANFAKQRIELGIDDLENGCPPSLPIISRSHAVSAEEHIISLLVGAAWDHYRKGNKWMAIKKIFSAIKLKPFSWSLWKGLVAIIIKNVNFGN